MALRERSRRGPGRPRALLRAVLAALAAGLLACATNPATGEREVLLVSEESEAESGEEAARQVAEQWGFVPDGPLPRYVERVGARVARHAPRPELDYRFHVVDRPEANAFALPGGHLYLTRGLLALLNSEDELASILGHEIAHVAARHAAQRQTRAVGLQLLSVLAMAAAGTAGGPNAGAAGVASRAAAAGALAAYGRDQEREADRLGQRYAARAGFDPAALGSALRTLENEQRLATGYADVPGFFDTHPAGPERIARAATRADVVERAGRRGIAPARSAFLERLEGLLIGPNPAGGLFREERFLHPDLDLSVRFPAGWRTVNTRPAVGALSPEREAQIVLELAGEGEDAAAVREVARRDARRLELRVREEGAHRIAGRPAWRAVGLLPGPAGALAADVTWIARAGRVFRLMGRTPPPRYASHAGTFRATARSVRGLTEAEREAVRAVRLELAELREGESLEGLAERTGSVWSPRELAVANGLAPGSAPEAGALLKVARAEPYAGAEPASASSRRPAAPGAARLSPSRAQEEAASRHAADPGAAAVPGPHAGGR